MSDIDVTQYMHLLMSECIYRFLEDICGSESDVCQEFVRDNRKEIQKLIIKSMESAQKTSKGVSISDSFFYINKQKNMIIIFTFQLRHVYVV